MSFITSQSLLPATELSATMDGTDVLIGMITQCPAIIIFKNRGTVDIQITWNDVAWQTFSAGEGLVLDLTANNGAAATRTIDIGTSFYGNGASGDFSISYVYAKPN